MATDKDYERNEILILPKAIPPMACCIDKNQKQHVELHRSA